MMSIIDMSGVLHFFETKSESGVAKPIDFQRRDVWDIRWARVSIERLESIFGVNDHEFPIVWNSS